MARMTAAAAPTRKSLLERGDGLGEMTRRELPMVAFTWGSEVTGMGAREGCGAALDRVGGATGESGTASGSICASGSRGVATRGPAGGWPGFDCGEQDSGESGDSGGRM